jgi:hypothetical protein
VGTQPVLFLFLITLSLLVVGPDIARCQAKPSPVLDLLNPPSPVDWQKLADYSNTLTRQQFESRLQNIFDPSNCLPAFLKISNASVTVFSSTDTNREELVKIDFTPANGQLKPSPATFRTPEEFAKNQPDTNRPLTGLKIVIEPADIGGKWGDMEDRSTFYPHFGLIQEGDINLTLGKILREKLAKLGANVFLVRENNEPVSGCVSDDLNPVIEDILKNRRYLLPESYFLTPAVRPRSLPAKRKSPGTPCSPRLSKSAPAPISRTNISMPT